MVAEDAPLVDVMTDKATVEMTAPVSGRIVSIHGEPGEMAPVGSAIAVFETEAEAGAEPAPAPKANGAAQTPAAEGLTKTPTKAEPSQTPPQAASTQPKPIGSSR
jgi:2-oxoisovalerate dehydrogenase E2 component (dihydrolipoyl transacylase)